MSVPTGVGLEVSVQDVADCFYQFRIPRELARMLGPEPVRAKYLGVRSAGGQAVRQSDWIVPYFTVFPMGFLWALQWTHETHLDIFRRHGLLGLGEDITDDRPPPAFDRRIKKFASH